MENIKDKRASINPMRVAWALRADLRRGASIDEPMSDWFKMWWLIHAPREYPACANHHTLCTAKLFAPMPQWPMNSGFGMTPALNFLLETRADLGNFDVNTIEGLWDAISWLFVHGVREHNLSSALDNEILASLEATPPFLTNDTLPNIDANVPEVTWLMYFLWRISADLKTNFDLACANSRQKYVIWFLLRGVREFKLTSLATSRQRGWLREKIFQDRASDGIPRIAYLLWLQHEQLQKAFDIQTESGVKALGMWANEVWHTQPELSWIEQLPNPEDQQKSIAGKRPFGLNLIGFAFGELGIGEDVRMAVAACEASGIPFTVVNINPGDRLRQSDQELAAHVTATANQKDPAPYSFNLFCLTGFDTARVFLERGNELFGGRYNIGWWPWELPVWPHEWLFAFNLVDEIWAATTFTHQMYSTSAVTEATIPTTTVLMPMPVSVERLKPTTRQALGLPDNKFLFLYVFDFNSYLARKNPIAAVDAFRKAFDEQDDSVRLVLKTMNSDPKNIDWQKFLRNCSEDKRVIILDRTLDRGEVLGLIQNCNAYVSLHRAEGFGRTLAEAMLFGKQVIATDFSGNTDFVNAVYGFPVRWTKKYLTEGDYPYIRRSDQAWWAEPDTDHAAICMREAVSAERSLPIQNAIHKFASKIFTPSDIGERILYRLRSLSIKLQ